MNDIILLIVTYYILAILLIILVLNLIQYASKKKYKGELDNLDVEKNEIIDAPIMTELSKVESLTKTKSIKEKYILWKKEIDDIKEKMTIDVNDMILEADLFLEQKDFKDYLSKKTNIEIKLYEAKELKARLLKEIKEITLSEERNRIMITDLKTKFRDIIHIFETTKDTFEPVTKPVELQIENIEKMFQDFEVFMEKQDYVEANKIVDIIDTLIKHLETIVDEIPGALALALTIIPKRIAELKSSYENMVKNG